MKHVISISLSFLLLLTALPLGGVAVSAASSGTTGDCTWTLDGTHLTILGSGQMEDYSRYNIAPWYALPITEVTIEDGVTAIGDYAFYECFDLTLAHIPNSVTIIGSHAFQYCESLTSVTIPDRVTTIGDNAFSLCTGLSSVTIPNNVTTIEFSTFAACFNLASVTIPNSVTAIGNDAFAHCSSLTDVYYDGTKSDRSKISMGSRSDYLLNATWHYTNSENLYGDLNGDGQIGVLDLALFQRYLNGWNVEILYTTCDLNNDGNINIKDLGLLQQYLNGWDVQLGT